MNNFDALPLGARWKLLVDAAKRGAVEKGYKISRVPGRGLSNVWRANLNGKTELFSVRTTRDRWFAFQPVAKGAKWKTLDDVNMVLVAAVDRYENPRKVEVYLFPADDVRARFHASYAARIKENHKVRDDFGMWVCLDTDKRPTAAAVGAGLADAYKPIAVYEMADLLAQIDEGHEERVDAGAEEVSTPRTAEVRSQVEMKTIADVIGWARERIAEIAGVRTDAVTLDLKLEI